MGSLASHLAFARSVPVKSSIVSLLNLLCGLVTRLTSPHEWLVPRLIIHVAMLEKATSSSFFFQGAQLLPPSDVTR